MRVNYKVLSLLCTLMLLLGSVFARSAFAQGGTVKIGVLHSLSGTMAISEASLRDAVELAVEEINDAGGVLGKKIQTVVVDPASDESYRRFVFRHGLPTGTRFLAHRRCRDLSNAL